MTTTPHARPQVGQGPIKPAASLSWVIIVAVLLIVLAATVLYLL